MNYFDELVIHLLFLYVFNIRIIYFQTALNSQSKISPFFLKIMETLTIIQK